jgi:hypothetical protein
MVSFGFFFFVVCFFVWAWYSLLLFKRAGQQIEWAWQHKGKDQERAICVFVAVKKRPRMFLYKKRAGVRETVENFMGFNSEFVDFTNFLFHMTFIINAGYFFHHKHFARLL